MRINSVLLYGNARLYSENIDLYRHIFKWRLGVASCVREILRECNYVFAPGKDISILIQETCINHMKNKQRILFMRETGS